MGRRLAARPLAYLVLAGLSLAGVGQLARSAVRDLRAPATRIDDRYREVLAAVPDHATLGYASDLPPDSPEGDYRFYERYYQAQYACAPRLLIESQEPALVLADVSDPSAVDALAAGLGARVVRRSTSGLTALLARGDEPR